MTPTQQIKIEISMLRQWLNEDRIADPKKMVFDENLYNWLPSLPTLLSDYERLEKEAEAGRKLAEALEKMKPKKIDERNHANITVPVFGELASRLLLSRERLSEKVWSDRIKKVLATYNLSLDKELKEIE